MKKKLNESHIYAIWEKQALNHDLYTKDGKQLRIIYPGYRNSDKGPDFISAKILIDGSEIQGDVEIHTKTSDWSKHGHSNNSDYDNVVLHAVWKHDDSIIMNSKGNELDTLVMSEFISKAELREGKSGQVCVLFAGLSSLQVNHILLKFGNLRMKSKGYLYDSVQSNLHYVIFFRQLAKILGAPNNKNSMRTFLGLINSNIYYEKKKTFEDLAKTCGLNDPESTMWKRFRVRPSASIARRAQFLYYLVDRHYNAAYLDKLLMVFQNTSSYHEFEKSIVSSLLKVDSKMDIGLSLKKILIFNCYLPYLLFYYKSLDDKKHLAKIKTYINNFPKLSMNRITKLMLANFSDYQLARIPDNEVYYQGMHYLFNEHCKTRNCTDCYSHRDLLKVEINEE